MVNSILSLITNAKMLPSLFTFMEILAKLFGSTARVKIMRLFLFHPEKVYDTKDVAEVAKTTLNEASKEILALYRIGLLKRRTTFREVTFYSKDKKKRKEKRKISGWALQNTFPYLSALQNLLINTVLVKNNDIVKRVGRTGTLKLVVIAGVFTQDWESRVDLLIVGDRFKKNLLENIIASMEAEIGKEIRYAVFETGDFQYRLSIYDKLIRDILDFPHKKIFNKLEVSTSL